MAIKRLDPTAKFKVICVYDDALDLETKEEIEALGEEGSTRYQKYMEKFDESELKFKEGSKPTRFHIRCLKANELADLNSKYQRIDTVKKTVEIQNRGQMMLDIFATAVLGVEKEDGSVEKIDANEVEFNVAVEIGSMVSLLTTLGKNLKKA